MKRIFVLALVLMFAPAMASAQVEIGVDAGLSYNSYDSPTGFDIDSDTYIDLPASYLRVAFPASETLLVETALGFSRSSSGGDSFSTILLLPGVNLLLGEQFYVRGEVGLWRGSGGGDSATQYAFGGAAGLRMPLGDAALFRAEAGVDKWLENQDDGLLGQLEIRAVVGISAVVN